MNKVVLLSFADSKMAETLYRIKREAEYSGFFDEIYVLTEKDFEPEYWIKYKKWFLNNKRGYGYWIWKSHLINKLLANIEKNDWLVYLDAGCEINVDGRKRFEEYKQLVSNSDLGILCFSTGCKEGLYDKGDVLDFLGMRNNTDSLLSSQIMATLVIFCKKDSTISFVAEWEKLIHENLDLVSDAPSVSPNIEGFIENRHDQSFFSLLIKKKGGAVILSGGSEVEVWPMTNINWHRLKKTPFHAVRNKTGKSRMPNSCAKKFLVNLRLDLLVFLRDTYIFLRVTIGKIRRQLITVK